MVDALGVVAVRLALHTGDPGGANSATNECTGGGYGRATIAWGTAASGSSNCSSTPIAFTIAAGQTVSWMSCWNSGGTVRYWKKDVTDEAFGSAGTYTVTDLDMDLNDT